MTLPRFEYTRLPSLEQALDVLHSANDQVKVLAGGTDLVVSLQQKLFSPKIVLDIRAVFTLLYGIATMSCPAGCQAAQNFGEHTRVPAPYAGVPRETGAEGSAEA
jgi:hypothetical protein